MHHQCYALKNFLTPKENSKLHGEKLVFRQDHVNQDIKFTGSVNICTFIHCSSFFSEIQNLILTALKGSKILIPNHLTLSKTGYLRLIIKGSKILIPPSLKTSKTGYLRLVIIKGLKILIPPSLKTEKNRLFTPDSKGLKYSDPPITQNGEKPPIYA